VAARRHAHAQAFRERLLATLERQNELLARLVERVERGSSTPDTG
jgi:hypothetical protein